MEESWLESWQESWQIVTTEALTRILAAVLEAVLMDPCKILQDFFEISSTILEAPVKKFLKFCKNLSETCHILQSFKSFEFFQKHA